MRKYCFNLQLVESADAKPEGGNLWPEGPTAFTEKHPPVNGPEQVKSALLRVSCVTKARTQLCAASGGGRRLRRARPAPGPPE